MKVLFATNRKETDTGFSDNASDGLRVGEAIVAIKTRYRQAGERVNDGTTYEAHDLARDSSTGNPLTGEEGIENIFENLTSSVIDNEKATSVRTSVLLYIHGFRNSFQKSVERGARLAHVYGSDTHQFVPLVLSWPSKFERKPDGFVAAQANAEVAGQEMAKIYDGIVELAQARFMINPRSPKPCAEMCLVAHSMGVYMLRHMVQSIRETGTSLFNVAILAAANEHRDSLGDDSALRPLKDLARRTAVYCYNDDSTLNLGYIVEAFKFGECLGLHGPSPYAFHEYPGELTAIKCRDVIPPDYSSKHNYYHKLANAVCDVRQVLDGKPTADMKNRRLLTGGIWNNGEQVYLLKP